jgi:hypothetical protein
MRRASTGTVKLTRKGLTVLFYSDIHANVHALEAVLEDSEAQHGEPPLPRLARDYSKMAPLDGHAGDGASTIAWSWSRSFGDDSSIAGRPASRPR